MKRSIGILLYRKIDEEYQILLTHFGGPYWSKKDKGAWSLQKGLQEAGETALETAVRETSEETNLQLQNEISYLASKKVSNNKLVIMFASYFDGSIENFKSNTFSLEFPPKSGIVKEYPEMDKIRWLSLKDAKDYICPSQLFFLERFEDKIKNNKLPL